MLDSALHVLRSLVGYGVDDLTGWHLLARAVVIYAGGLALVRLGKRRFMGSYSAFDMVLGITIGALLANASADDDRFFNALGLVVALVALHWALARATYRWAWLDGWVKGENAFLVRDGEVDREALRRTAISDSDLVQAIRGAGVGDLGSVSAAVMERSGQISVVERSASRSDESLEDAVRRGSARPPGPRDASPHVVSVEVAEGVQRVVVEWRGPES